MDTLRKSKILGEAAKFDVHTTSIEDLYIFGIRRQRHRISSGVLRGLGGIYPAVLPSGRCLPLFKTLLSNACIKDCFYCANRAQRNITRANFKPTELAKLFMELYNHRLVRGIFLSSAVDDSPNYTMEQIIKTAELLRYFYNYSDYLHLKILPGAHPSYIERALRLADRISINIEAPSAEYLSRISSTKDFETELLAPIKFIKSLSEHYQIPSSGWTTQFVVGPAGETDYELLRLCSKLYKEFGLRRAYFSAFQPVEDTPLQDILPTSKVREHRLYQADFLVRTYNFRLEELPFIDNNLPQEIDPKLAFALNNLQMYPIEVNRASYEELLRIPGIGPRSAKRILQARRAGGKLKDIAELKILGAVVKRAKPFVLVNGKSYNKIESISKSKSYQLSLALW